MKDKLKNICSLFQIYGDYVSGIPFGTGHINDTYQITYNQGGTLLHYTLQRLNTNVFRRPLELMENVSRVTQHIHNKIELEGASENSRHTLQLVLSHYGKPYVFGPDGYMWRCYLFIEKARTYDVLETTDMAYQAAKAFGGFQQYLVDLPGKRLFEVIPDFHNTPSRIAALKKAAEEDIMGRRKYVEREIDFILSREDDAGLLIALNKSGDIPERITHNDTKLNNVLLDDTTMDGVCVIDLDTVMPGLVHYDFGDMVRTGTSPAAEDEQDLSKVYMRFEMFEALLRGYLSSAACFLNEAEREYLPFSGKLITMEIGTRFLTDYLMGDVYFKVHRDGHNLDRCRTQLKLVESIESQMDRMKNLLKDIR